jgi:hypothetical protein
MQALNIGLLSASKGKCLLSLLRASGGHFSRVVLVQAIRA